jgi:hypothetical protein
MHTALVTRLLRDRSLWEEAQISREEDEQPERTTAEPSPAVLHR